MRKVVVLGAGKIGSVVADLLAGCGDYQVIVADAS
jgi:saccharopine dehydrogenase-like NADP-dependent oxidoreductase